MGIVRWRKNVEVGETLCAAGAGWAKAWSPRGCRVSIGVAGIGPQPGEDAGGWAGPGVEGTAQATTGWTPSHTFKGVHTVQMDIKAAELSELSIEETVALSLLLGVCFQICFLLHCL